MWQYNSQNKQPICPYTALTGWTLYCSFWANNSLSKYQCYPRYFCVIPWQRAFLVVMPTQPLLVLLRWFSNCKMLSMLLMQPSRLKSTKLYSRVWSPIINLKFGASCLQSFTKLNNVTWNNKSFPWTPRLISTVHVLNNLYVRDGLFGLQTGLSHIFPVPPSFAALFSNTSCYLSPKI